MSCTDRYESLRQETFRVHAPFLALGKGKIERQHFQTLIVKIPTSIAQEMIEALGYKLHRDEGADCYYKRGRRRVQVFVTCALNGKGTLIEVFDPAMDDC